MQARRGFILFRIGKSATGVGLIEMMILEMRFLVIKRSLFSNIRKKTKQKPAGASPAGFYLSTNQLINYLTNRPVQVHIPAIHMDQLACRMA
jgi:hypothetical protein